MHVSLKLTRCQTIHPVKQRPCTTYPTSNHGVSAESKYYVKEGNSSTLPSQSPYRKTVYYWKKRQALKYHYSPDTMLCALAYATTDDSILEANKSKI